MSSAPEPPTHAPTESGAHPPLTANRRGRFNPRGPYQKRPRTIPTCHPERLHASRGLCEPCYKKWRFERNPALAENHRREAREYAQTHRDNEIKRSRARLLKQCGLTETEYQQLIVIQESKCAICGVSIEKPRFDHDHDTDKARGLLCNHCNLKLGKIEDEAWRALADKYLSKFVKVDAKVELHER